MLQKVKQKFFRFLLFVYFSEKGAIINNFNSITAPKEIFLQKSQEMQLRMEEFQSLIRPVLLKREQLKRYGSIADGGYVLPISVVNKSKFLISGGIENNNEFELSLAKLGITGVQIDNSIDKPPKFHKNLSFIRATLGNRNEINIDTLLNNFPGEHNGILKLDIEGAEYVVLSELTSYARFNVITVEFHNLYMISEDIFWDNFKKVLTNIRQNHEVVFISPNNCCGYTILGGYPVPNVMEVTFAKKKLINGRKLKLIDALHPREMKPNYADQASLDIATFFPYLVY